MSKKSLLNFELKNQGQKTSKESSFLKFFCMNCPFYCSGLRLKGENEKKEAIDEVESHFTEKYNLDK